MDSWESKIADAFARHGDSVATCLIVDPVKRNRKADKEKLDKIRSEKKAKKPVKKTAQQLARQRLAATDLARFAPPPKPKKAEPDKPKITKPAVILSAEEKKERQRAYARAYYERNKDYCR